MRQIGIVVAGFALGMSISHYVHDGDWVRLTITVIGIIGLVLIALAPDGR